MTNKVEMREYNLRKRTQTFAESTLRFVSKIPATVITRPLISQLVRSSTSVGANYHEADNAESPKDFRHKLGICLKEARETQYWLRLVSVACPAIEKTAVVLADEANELVRIFNSSIRTVNRRIGH